MSKRVRRKSVRNVIAYMHDWDEFEKVDSCRYLLKLPSGAMANNSSGPSIGDAPTIQLAFSRSNQPREKTSLRRAVVDALTEMPEIRLDKGRAPAGNISSAAAATKEYPLAAWNTHSYHFMIQMRKHIGP